MESFVYWWQHLPSFISPVLVDLGFIQIRYYGLMYVLSFLVIYFLAVRYARSKDCSYTADLIEDYLFWSIFGVVIGSRLGYVLFYDLVYFVKAPLQIFVPFDFTNGVSFVGISGLSYHGGLVGFVLITLVFCYQRKIKFLEFTDFLAPIIPLGYMFGRIGNFLNHELYGRVTSVSWGMFFPTAPDYVLRHPSQLYEAFFEGVFLFILLSVIKGKGRAVGIMSAMYLMGYGGIRFIIEYFREPDGHIGVFMGHLSMGQLLCLVMILGGGGVILLLQKGT